jgi:hypothetical protein
LVSSASGYLDQSGVYDPLGADVGFNDPYLLYETPDYETLTGGRALYRDGNPFDSDGGCSLDGLPISCTDLAAKIDHGSVKTEYVGLYQFDPDQDRNARTRRRVPVTKDIPSYGLGFFQIWMPPEFRNEFSRGAFVTYVLPTSVTEDDPPELQGENNGPDCGIVVTFKPGTTYPGASLPNGPSTITYNGPNFGLGFSVSGWVGEGGIGTIGVDDKGKKVTNPMNKKGRWSLEQWTHSWIGENGKVIIEKQTFPDLPTDETGIKAYDNTFGFYDHPGGRPPSPGLERFENHLIKVYRGKTVCEVKFHFIQRGNTIHWGSGFL